MIGCFGAKKFASWEFRWTLMLISRLLCVIWEIHDIQQSLCRFFTWLIFCPRCLIQLTCCLSKFWIPLRIFWCMPTTPASGWNPKTPRWICENVSKVYSQCKPLFKFVCLLVCMSPFVCMYLCMCTYLYIYIYICTWIYIYISIGIMLHVFMSIHIHFNCIYPTHIVSSRQSKVVLVKNHQLVIYSLFEHWPVWQPRRLSHLNLHGFRQGQLYHSCCFIIQLWNPENHGTVFVSYLYSHHDYSSLFFSIQLKRNLLENSNSNPTTRHGGVCSLLPCFPHLCSAWCHLSLCWESPIPLACCTRSPG